MDRTLQSLAQASLGRRAYRALWQWGFRRLYHEAAWSYDLVAACVSHGYWERWILAVIPLLQTGTTLEIGCGTGYLQRALAFQGAPLMGIDSSRQMLHVARAKLGVTGGPLTVACADAACLPAQSASAVNVVATFPAPFILQAAVLQDIRRVLRPDGQLLIIDHGAVRPAGWYEMAVDLVACTTIVGTEHDPRPHLLEQAGFAVEQHRLPVEASEITVFRARPVAQP